MPAWTRETPWRQGNLLPNAAVQVLELSYLDLAPEQSIVIVATHDCDLAQDQEVEPLVEVVLGRRIDIADGNYTHAKNARTLHLRFEGESPLTAQFSATAKHAISKEMLAAFQPENEHKLSPSGQAIFQRWLAARYRRSAFPDEFERRLVRETKLADRIAKAVKPHGELITAVLFDVDEGQEISRVDSDDVYVLDITLLHAVVPDSGAATLAAITAKEQIETDFKNKLFNAATGTWKNIELRYFDVLSEETLSYRLFTLLKPWRLEYISLATNPQQPMAPE